MLLSLVGFLVAILVLVTVHEWGHYIVARWFSVKVLCFSVGFGKKLWSTTDSRGCEFCVSAIPLGGYVRFLDTRELAQDKVQELSESDRSQAFDLKPAWQKILIVVAGPIVNLLLPILLFTLTNWGSNTALLPMLGDVPKDSVVAQAGLQRDDVILTVDDAKVDTWGRFQLALVKSSLDKNTVSLTVQRDNLQSFVVNLPLPKEVVNETFDWQQFGLQTWTPNLAAVVGEVMPDSAASQANLRTGDEIVAIDQQTVNGWSEMVSIIQQNPEKPLIFKLDRAGVLIEQLVHLHSRVVDGKLVGILGIRVHSDEKAWSPAMITVERNLFEALQAAIDQTVAIVKLMVSVVANMFTSGASLDQLGGPIAIADQAGKSVSMGWKSFLSFLSLLSISLGILNLLPIPLLDGGHIVLHTWEQISGRELSASFQKAFQRIGIVFVMSLMILAFTNDLLRLF